MTFTRNLFNLSEEDLKEISKNFDNKDYAFVYRTIFDASPDIIYISDYRGIVLDVNQAFINKIGVKREDIKNVSMWDFYVGDITESLKENIKKIRNGKEIKKIEVKVKNIEGKLFDFEINSLPIQKDGKILIVINIARDITKRKEMEGRLKESEEKYRLISENANDLIAILNNRFKYEYINEDAFNQILDYSNEDLIGKSALKFIHPDDVSHGAKSLFEGFKNGIGGAELRFRHKSGKWIWIEAKGQVYNDANGTFRAIVISRDVTKRKLNEQKIIESERKFRHLYNQLGFYKDLIAHDISNVLHVIQASTELLSLQFSDENSKAIEDFLPVIEKQIERGTKIMSNAFSLNETDENEISIRSTKICNVLKNSIEFIEKTYEERNVKIELTCDCTNENVCVKASYLLQDIFDNILINAIKYNSNNLVEIQADISSEIIEDVKFIKIEIEDNGIGISDDKKLLIFEKGNKELKKSKGMGLGLSIVKKIVDSYQGKIWVENRVKGDHSQGTKVITLLREII